MKKIDNRMKCFRYAAAMILCIFINCVGRQTASHFSLPGWLDSYGTFIAAYMLGPVPGAVSGMLSNILFGCRDIKSAAYLIVSLYIGLEVGRLSKKGYFETLFHTMTVAGIIASGCVVLSSALNIFLYNGTTNNVWGDGVMDYLRENGAPKPVAGIIGEFYIEFPDKLVTSLALFILIHLSRNCGGDTKKKLAKDTAALSACLIVFAQLAPLTFRSDAADKDNNKNVTHISYIQNVYDSGNGLLCGHANAVAETKNGIIWIGTYAGLYRYNGREFLHMSYLEGVKNVNCLFVDDLDRVWIGTNDNGVAVMKDENIIDIINSEDGLPSDTIKSITQTSDGLYYIGTANGIVSLKHGENTTVNSDMEEIDYTSKLSADKLGNAAAIDSEGKLYILRDGKILTTLEKSFNRSKMSCCNFAEDNTLFVGTTDGLVSEYTLENDKLKNIRNINCSEVTKINNIYPDEEDDMIWLCSDDGIGYISPSHEFTMQETGDFNRSIENMITDYQGNLWFASSRLGLLNLSRSSVTDIYSDAGIKPDVVNTTAIFNGLLYVGTDDGLKIIDMAAHRQIENNLTSEHFKGNRIRCLMTDSKGLLWVCSYGSGLASVDKDGSVNSYSTSFGQIGNRVRVCIELSDGTIVSTCTNGIIFLKDGRPVSSIDYGDKFGHAQVVCLLEAADGTLYAGTDGNGIAVIKDGEVTGRLTRKDGLSSDTILRLVKDPEDGSIFIVTSNSICYMKDGSIRCLENFPYSNNYDIILDDDGEMFITGSAGIYVVNKKDLLDNSEPEYNLLNKGIGLDCSPTVHARNAITADKDLYLSTPKGVFKFNLDHYLLSHDNFNILLNTVKLDDNYQQLKQNSELVVERDTAKIEFIPEIINYTHYDPTIAYCLEGFESNWTKTTLKDLRSITYTNLKPGDYVLRLAVLDENGSKIKEISYAFEKKMAIYDHFWFRYYMIGVAAVFVGWLTWYITRTQIHRTLQLQQTKLALALQQVQMGNETILAIAKTVDAKDLRTSKHSQRVSEYSALIAKEYGFSKEEQENIRNAALLHDIGKIGIPDSVLNKPGRLTDEEYTIMKTHVTRGAEILKDFTLIDHVVEGARYHHERYDGKGYPDKLKGEEIPLYGRIISIADAFDAMTANRVYRKRQDFDYVMSELHKGRGTQFDPELLDIFLKIIDEKKIDIDALYSPNAQPGEESADIPAR